MSNQISEKIQKSFSEKFSENFLKIFRKKKRNTILKFGEKKKTIRKWYASDESHVTLKTEEDGGCLPPAVVTLISHPLTLVEGISATPALVLWYPNPLDVTPLLAL